jgi:hypothetical protein
MDIRVWISAFLVREGFSALLLHSWIFFKSKVDFVVGKGKRAIWGRMHVLTKQIQRRPSFPFSLYIFLPT